MNNGIPIWFDLLLLLLAAGCAGCLWSLVRLTLELLALCPDRARQRRMLASAVRVNSAPGGAVHLRVENISRGRVGAGSRRGLIPPETAVRCRPLQRPAFDWHQDTRGRVKK